MLNIEGISEIAVVGGGSWGTTLANLLARKGFHVDLWVREKEVFDQIRLKRVNETFLPGVYLDDRLRPLRRFEDVLEGKNVVVTVAPSHVLRDVLADMKPYLAEDVVIVSATKGIENDSLMVMSEVAGEVLGNGYEALFTCLSGPSFAKEVSAGLPAAVTVASLDGEIGPMLQRLFSTESFRVYLCDDLVGVQLGGALKNVIAIAAGICDGLGFGYNARAALITRGLAEITRLGVSMGAEPLTFSGLAGLGDLVLTCTGDLSRNRSVGVKIGQGEKIGEILGPMKMVAEGVKTCRSAHMLGLKKGVDMPITREVYEVLYERKAPKDAVKNLMARELKNENEF
ncbi:MAG: NAD(P)H-dependent glycerol-3-phosphate dehydrogenase [Desulfatiglandaceae bacterium]